MWALVVAYRVLSVLCNCWNFLYIVSFVLGHSPAFHSLQSLPFSSTLESETAVVLRIQGEAYAFAWMECRLRALFAASGVGRQGSLLEQILYKNVGNIGCSWM